MEAVAGAAARPCIEAIRNSEVVVDGWEDILVQRIDEGCLRTIDGHRHRHRHGTWQGDNPSHSVDPHPPRRPRPGSPGQPRVRGLHFQHHGVRVWPNEAQARLREGEEASPADLAAVARRNDPGDRRGRVRRLLANRDAPWIRARPAG